MRNAQAIEHLAVEVCRAIREIRRENQAWIGIDGLRDRLGLDERRTVDAAVAFARAKG